jgi:peptidoglycan/xylan/chitin deacetylase (PgdA/CDA1 family)
MVKGSSRIFVLLSHDVEWSKRGAPLSHILERKERFDENVLENLERENPYQNIRELLELEEELGLRSTFFFRTYVEDSQHPPPPYDLSEYKQDIRYMISKGWEVGLHSDMTSHNNLERLKREKASLEKIAGTKIFGNRVHYTIGNTLDSPLFRNLNHLGFKYDSSVKYKREEISEEDLGYFLKEGITVFPITIMDALIFYYNVKTETEVLKTIKHAIGMCRRFCGKSKIVTIDWHDCSLKMKYGRRYPEVLDYLASQKNVRIKRGIDLANMIEKGEIQ